VPAITDAQLVSGALTPPSEAACFAIGRRCFTASAMQNSYNLPPLYAAGDEGQGVTIAIIDSFGSPNMASDLANFNTQMGLPHMCGEANHTCTAGDPTFTRVYWNGQTPGEVSTAQEPGHRLAGARRLDRGDRSRCRVGACNGAQGEHPQRDHKPRGDAGRTGSGGDDERRAIHRGPPPGHGHHAELRDDGGGFNSTQSLLNLRHAFISAAANGVTVLASTGDGGTANAGLTPVRNPATFPFPTVNWPASDPLVTAVGGTYLCTDPVTGSGVDSVDPPINCQNNPGVREIGWIDSGGGFSHIFPTPSYQSTLPNPSTPIGSMRGIPDVAFQASSRTASLVYATFDGGGGWFLVGGTSCSSPEFAGFVAIADQIAGHGLGQINPTLYTLASGPNYGSYFYDVTTGNNQADPSVPGYPATTGWDPVTGLGTPNAAKLVPALAAG
jgi:subtilase family serine protease